MESTLIGRLYYLPGLDLWVPLKHSCKTRETAHPCESPSKARGCYRCLCVCWYLCRCICSVKHGGQTAASADRSSQKKVRKVEIVRFSILKRAWSGTAHKLHHVLCVSKSPSQLLHEDDIPCLSWRLSWKLGLSVFLRGVLLCMSDEDKHSFLKPFTPVFLSHTVASVLRMV